MSDPMQITGAAANASPIYSDFQDDPDMLELIEMFVDDLPDRVEALRSAVLQEDFEAMACVAHQLKGAGGGYGFPAITENSAKVESLAKAFRDAVEPAPSIEAVTQSLQQLIDVCNRATAQPASEA